MLPLEGLKNFRKRALVIAAHPDDETLFMGGMIAEFKKWYWTVICVTDCDERYNRARIRELMRVCGIYNEAGGRVKAVTLGIKKNRERSFKTEVRSAIRAAVRSLGSFDIVFTHDAKGDYGHKTHKLVHQAVSTLNLRNVYNFVSFYDDGACRNKPARRKRHAGSVRLSAGARRIKKLALDVYLKGSQKTNLSRLNRLVKTAYTARSEHFHKYN